LLQDLYPYASKVYGFGKKTPFTQLLEDAMRKLDPDSNFSMFKVIVLLICCKAFRKITNSAFDFLLKILHSELLNFGLPKSLYDMKLYIRVMGLRY
jgi:hypothetical protein